MADENSSQKSFVGQMNTYFALGDTFAHIRALVAVFVRSQTVPLLVKMCC